MRTTFSRRVAAVAAGGVGWLVAANAGAYCRTVSKAPPADWNVATRGCYTGEEVGAKQLYWGNACIGYSLQKDGSRQATLEQATAAAASAFAVWNDAACSGGKASIQAMDMGPVECGEARYNQKLANQNVIVFRDDTWPYSDPNNTLGLTTVTFDTATGELLGSDMEINGTQKLRVANAVALDDAPSDDGADGFDLATILMHEAGHFLGLAHSASNDAVMYARYQEGVPLSTDDQEGLCTVYTPSATRITSSGVVAAGACDPKPPNGFSSQCAAPAIPSTEDKGEGSGCAVRGMSGSGEGAKGMWVFMSGLFGAFAWRRSKRRGAWATWAAMGASAAILISAIEARASVAIAVLFDELVGRSSAAVVVTPVGRESAWEDGRIVTYTRLQVDRLIAGSAPSAIEVRSFGGSVGKIGQIVEGEASFDSDRAALAFLEPARGVAVRHGSYAVTARAQGVFALSSAAPGVAVRLVVPENLRASSPPRAWSQGGAMLLAPRADASR
ncbi:MAG: matrixin family metalloprotease, partial [Polyangiaceae bacterium]